MRIGGASEFFSRISRSAQDPLKTAANSTTLNPYLIKKGVDTLDVSEIGTRLRFNSESASALNEMRKAAEGDSVLELMAESISGVQSVFEEMRGLAILAQDENISTEDRLILQMQMEKLKERMDYASQSMADKFAVMSGQDVTKFKRLAPEGATGNYLPEGAEDTTVLSRAMERVKNGGEWNIAEAVQSFDELEKIVVYKATDYTPGHEIGTIEVEPGEQFVMPKGLNSVDHILDYYGSSKKVEWYAATETEAAKNKIPTIMDRLKDSKTIVLMDAESAAEGVVRLDRELEKIKNMQEEFIKFSERNNASSAGKSGLMDEAEVDLLLGRMAQEEEAKRQGSDSRASGGGGGRRFVYEFAADVNGHARKAQAEEAKVVKAAGPIDSNQFYTTLGLMEFKGPLSGDKSRPRLIDADNPKGELFMKFQDYFDKVSKNFASAVSENIGNVKHTWTNANLTSWFENEGEGSIYRSDLFGYTHISTFPGMLSVSSADLFEFA